MLKNKSKNTILAHKTHLCNSLLSKLLGLMFRREIKDQAWIFRFKRPAKHSIHMVFVFFSIDIIFLNKDKRVIEAIHNLKPFAIYIPKKKYNAFIED